MKNGLLILSCFLTTLPALAFDPASAYRDENISYEVYESRLLNSEAVSTEMKELSLRSTPLGASIRYDETKLPKAVSWKSIQVMQERFEKIRDERFLESQRNNGTLRRSSWMYPDDGCYARASLANRNVFRWFAPVPHKVFVFGNLRVKTNNSPRGVVGWWYHVAPIVEVSGVKYVLDPAIEFSQPLILSDWLARMGNPAKMKVAICNSGTYSPSDNCEKETDGLELRAERAQLSYLNLEWDRMKRLGRESEL